MHTARCLTLRPRWHGNFVF